MTKEEKAIVTWTQEYRKHQFKDCYPSQQAFYQRGFVEGADWKDQQAAKDCESLVGLAVKEARQVFIDKACEVINQFCEGLEPHRRNFTIDDFRKAMSTKTNPLFEQALANVNPDTRAEVRGNMDAVLTWHKASDELPPYDKVVIVAYDGNTEDCCFNHRSNDPEVKTSENGWCDVGYDTEPTHWMYIPEIKED